MNPGPDENFYAAQAQAFRAGGFLALRDLAAEYIEEPKLWAYPSPLRWLWIAFLAGLGKHIRKLPIAAAIYAVIAALILFRAVGAELGHYASGLILVGLSPLLWISSRALLQDTTVAVLVIVAMGFAAKGNAVGVGTTLFVLASVKEAGWLAVPALAPLWWHSGAPWPWFLAALAIAAAAWAGATLAVLGTDAIGILRNSLSGHDTPYTHEHQQGAPHRLLIDVGLLSPLPLVLGVLAVREAPALALACGLLLAVHALPAVRNVRLVLASELLLRALAAITLSRLGPVGFPLALSACAAMDLYVLAKTREIYDPVTSGLTAALGMTKA